MNLRRQLSTLSCIVFVLIATCFSVVPARAGTVGACCLSDGTCEVTTLASCGESGGIYQGDDTTCDPNPCPQPPPTGACCFADGSCSQLPSIDCASQSGSYEGDGTDCFPNPCPQPTGACCFADGSCLVLTGAQCATQDGAYQGHDAPCDPNPCPQPPPTGACCFASGACIVLTASDCGAQGGNYQGDASACSPNPCPQPTGACCFADGSCLVRNAADCANEGGAYEGNDTSCAPNPCPQPTGACCFVDGSCTVVTSTDCAAQSGLYQGNETGCAPNPCPQPTGACCVGSACSILSALACNEQNGAYQGDDTSCTPNPCLVPTGGCCFHSGDCEVLSGVDCGNAGGTYEGDGTDCVPNPCPQPTGACCALDATCTILTAADCGAANGAYQGNDVACSPDPCPPPRGACCRSGGVCTLLEAAACADSTGRYEGDGALCNPNPCPEFFLRADGSGDQPTIQAAIDAASAGDVIELANGAFTGAGNKGLDFRGKAITLRSASMNPDSCYIDCEGSGRALYFKSGEDTTTVVEGLGIRGGLLSGVQRGAGVACVNASPLLRDCRILANGGGSQGGGLYCENASPALVRCVVAGNASQYGAGIYAKYVSAPRFVECTISGNDAASHGGGIYSASSSTITFERVILAGNCAANDGDDALLLNTTSDIDASCCLIDDAGVSGLGEITSDGRIFADPHFCGAVDCGLAPTIAGDYHVRMNSPALADSSGCDRLIGALGPACPALPRGACCLPQGGCVEVEAAVCVELAGNYAGDGTLCGSAGCPAGGACCLADGSCTISTSGLCAGSGGDYAGDNSACAPYPCAPFVVRANGTGDFANIQAALDALASGSIIELASGTFTGSGNRNLDFHGKAITVRAQASSPDLCILDCQSAGRAFNFTGGNGAIVRGLTIVSGRVTGSAKGAGVACVGASPIFENCLILSSRSDADGGAVYCENSAPVFRSCTIASSRAARGGGIFVSGTGGPSLDRSIVAGNCGDVDGSEIYLADVGSTLSASCSDIDSTGVSGSGALLLGSNVFFDDPLFCAPKSCTGGPGVGIYRISSASRCLPSASPCGQLVGALGQGCTTAPGACCLGGDCMVLISGTCAQQGGTYLGNGSDCDPSPCPEDGACCLPNNSCVFVTSAECSAASGDWLGAGIICPPTGCSANAGGFLLVHATTGLHYDAGGEYCGDSGLSQCALGTYQFSGADTVVFYVIAAFPSGSSPRMSGVTFGIDYDPESFALLDSGTCGDFELKQGAWPDSGSGVAVTWTSPRTAQLNEVYWFAGYNRHPGTASRFSLIPHPVQGASFADDSIPARLDPIVCLGALGFDGPGFACCATVDVPSSASVVPTAVRLLPIVPNPTSDHAIVSFEVPSESSVELSLYSAGGRRVRVLERGTVSAGRRELTWDRRDDAGVSVPAGVYFVRLTADGRELVQKLLVLR